MLALILAACSPAPAPPVAGSPPPTVEPAPAAVAATTHAELLERLDRGLRDTEALALRYPDDWGRWAAVAGLWMQRARHTGDLDDFARAEDALAVAFRIAPEGSGPLLSMAALDLSLHRLDRAEERLAVLERQRLDHPRRAAVLEMRADIALQRGDLAAAEAGYQQALALHDGFGARYGLVQVAWHRGRFDEALAGLDRAEAHHVHGRSAPVRMWIALQRGLIELSRGRPEAALAHYREAETHVAGHWLVREHVAEVTVLLGRPDEALAMYEDIVLDTHSPEFMDAVAEILLARGDQAGAARWIAWADRGFDRQLARFPEAAAGHALDHLLAFGDPAEAVALAERNAALRPNGEALTRLATAYRQAGRLRDADEAIRRAAATGWAWPDRFEEEAAIAGALGDAARALAARAEVARLRDS